MCLFYRHVDNRAYSRMLLYYSYLRRKSLIPVIHWYTVCTCTCIMIDKNINPRGPTLVETSYALPVRNQKSSIQPHLFGQLQDMCEHGEWHVILHPSTCIGLHVCQRRVWWNVRSLSTYLYSYSRLSRYKDGWDTLITGGSSLLWTRNWEL